MSEVDERSYREMVSAQDAAQVDTWAADLFIDFAKRLGVGNAIAAFCRATGLDEVGSSAPSCRGGPDRRRLDTAGSLAAPIFDLPRAIAACAASILGPAELVDSRRHRG